MSKQSERRLAENEVIFRQANEEVAKFIEEENGSDAATVKFFCECSKDDCSSRIELTTQAYNDAHQNKRQFIALPGHEIEEIERIVREEKGFNVIEKYGDPPKPEEIKRALKNMNAKSVDV